MQCFLCKNRATLEMPNSPKKNAGVNETVKAAAESAGKAAQTVAKSILKTMNGLRKYLVKGGSRRRTRRPKRRQGTRRYRK
jgi:hypothetical protein